MKQLTKTSTYKALISLILLSFFHVMAWAQESSESGITVIERHAWYTQPWAWVTGIALILIIIVALVPSNAPDNNSSTDKATS